MHDSDDSIIKRPVFSPRKQKALLRYIASGKPASQWLRKHGISHSQLYNCLSRDPSFHREYSHARKAMASTLADDMLEISDNQEEEIQRSRLRVDTRKWLASKLDSSAWGDKLQVETTSKISILDHLNDVINVTPERLESDQNS